MPSTHTTFVQDAKVIVTRPDSPYVGKRGQVYNSGPGTRANATNPAAVLWVRLDETGDCKKFLPTSLSLLPKPEAEYKVSNRTREGRNVVIHEIPSTRGRGRPMIFELDFSRN